MGIFSWTSSDKTNPSPSPEVDIEAGVGVMGRISQIGSSITNKADSAAESFQNMQVGLLVMATGLLFLFLSTLFLPLIMIAPHKFVMLNAFGNACIVTSIFLIRGLKYACTFMKKDKILFALGYVLTLVGEIYFAFLKPSYLFSILCFVLNAVSLVYVLFSFFKNGTAALNFVFKGMFGCVKQACKKIFGRGTSNGEGILSM